MTLTLHKKSAQPNFEGIVNVNRLECVMVKVKGLLIESYEHFSEVKVNTNYLYYYSL